MIRTRLRRGKVVEIPEQWLHNITTRGTIKERKELAASVRLDRKKRLRIERDFDFNNQLDTDQ